jgi:hypothetical protein
MTGTAARAQAAAIWVATMPARARPNRPLKGGLDIVNAVGLVKGTFTIPFVRPHIAIDAFPKIAEAFTEAVISSLQTKKSDALIES